MFCTVKTLYCNFLFFFWICFSYEAWVIYNFLSLCLAWVGGPGAVVLSLSGRVLKPSVCLMTCCLPPVPLDGWVYLYIYIFFLAQWIHRNFEFSDNLKVAAFYIIWEWMVSNLDTLRSLCNSRTIQCDLWSFPFLSNLPCAINLWITF